jgi:hypothetical protein
MICVIMINKEREGERMWWVFDFFPSHSLSGQVNRSGGGLARTDGVVMLAKRW